MTARRTVILGALAFLSGCTTLPQGKRIRSGRFSAKVSHSEKTESVSGRWRLTESGRETTLELMTPLYGILARVTIDDSGAVFEKPNQEPVRATSAEALMESHLGFAVPLSTLSSWLEGKPSPGQPHTEADRKTFVQAGWRVTVKRRSETGGVTVLLAERAETAISATLTLTLTIDAE